MNKWIKWSIISFHHTNWSTCIRGIKYKRHLPELLGFKRPNHNQGVNIYPFGWRKAGQHIQSDITEILEHQAKKKPHKNKTRNLKRTTHTWLRPNIWKSADLVTKQKTEYLKPSARLFACKQQNQTKQQTRKYHETLPHNEKCIPWLRYFRLKIYNQIRKKKAFVSSWINYHRPVT